jgi:hypothetical protein
MHRPDVVVAARQWHEQAIPNGVAGLVCRMPGARHAGVFGSAFGRTALVIGFVVALAIPLTAALKEVIREARVRGAVAEAATLLEAEGTSILGRQVELGSDSATARIRVATSMGVTGDAREAFRRRATELAGEPVYLRLEQLPLPGDASALQALLRGGSDRSDAAEASWPETVARARESLENATWSLPFPDSSEAVGVALHMQGGDVAADSVEIAYLAPRPLETQTSDVLGEALRRAVGHPELRTSFHLAGQPVMVPASADTTALGPLLIVLRRYPRLRVRIRSGDADSLMTLALLTALRSAGVDSVDIETRTDAGPLELLLARTPR